MTIDRRNPYLVLGVPYGATRADATRAFAQRSRRARRDTTFPYTVDDMTWALHQVEAHLENPAAAIDHFRVPADPSTLQPPTGPGVLRPPATPLERRTEPADLNARQSLRELARDDAVNALLERAAINATTLHVTDGPSTPLRVQLRTAPQRKRARWPWLVLTVALLAIAGVALVVYASRQNNEPSSSAAASSSPPKASTSTTAAPQLPQAPIDSSITTDLQQFFTVFERTEAAGIAYLDARDAAEAQFAAEWDGTGTIDDFNNAAVPWTLRLADAASEFESAIDPLANELKSLVLSTTEVDEIRNVAMNHYSAWRAYAPALAEAADDWVHGPINDFTAVADDYDLPTLEEQTTSTWTKLCGSLMDVASVAGGDFRQAAASHCET